MAYQALAARDTFNKIKIFERDDAPGGNWHYTSETPRSVPLSLLESDKWWEADYTPIIPESQDLSKEITYAVGENMTADEAVERYREFRLPKPIWKSMRTNSPSPVQQIPGFPWPPKARWRLHHTDVRRYLRSFASWLGINVSDNSPDISYNTRVEAVRKRFRRGEDGTSKQVGWTLVLRRYEQVGKGVYREVFWEERFAAIVVATGRFNVPHIPSVPGLKVWQDQFPNDLIHSRQYREPYDFTGKNVLIVGASQRGRAGSRSHE
ncbi:hypothetical protein I316_03915 [Kwoniella heveanensis BCC8398]|uniref:FAD/NAD(P)-binding domain-containing protein n=1 Tax=Kwoniella heveanensis BCC8398 TaxID=1296120 RepID=A0A1B9GTQ0_9TREE|nr:hypothetical protein I316_03915 [Kwoniella heveanensis BCC8398]